MEFEEAIKILTAGIDRIPKRAEELQRGGELGKASQVLYGELPVLERAIEVLRSPPEMLHEEDRFQVFRRVDGSLWASFAIDDINPNARVAPAEAREKYGNSEFWQIPIDAGYTLKERRDLVVAKALEAVKDGEADVAAQLETRLLPVIEALMDKFQTFEVLGRSEGADRVTLRDDEGLVWIAAPLETSRGLGESS